MGDSKIKSNTPLIDALNKSSVIKNSFNLN